MDRMVSSWKARMKRAFPFADRFIFDSMETVIKRFNDGLHEAGEDAERLACLWLKKRGFNAWRSATGSRADMYFKADILAFNPKTEEVWVCQVKAGFGLVGWVEYPSTGWIEKTHPKKVKKVFISVNPDSGDIMVWIDGEKEEILDRIELEEVMQNEKA